MEHLKELPEYAKFVSCVEEHNLLSGDANVIVAVSGGADSVAMLCMFMAYLPASRIFVAHVNHGIRGDEATYDADFVATLCKRFQLDFYLKKIDVPSIAKENGIGLEECAREERYRFLQTIACEKTGVIAVAHHREDRAETVLMNIARGTGIDGLKGISYRQNNVIRPLLDFNKDEILRVCSFVNIQPVTDSTNSEDCTLRNRVRHHVLPYLCEIFGRDMVDKLVHTSEHARIDSEFLENYAQDVMTHIVRQERDLCVVDRTAFAQQAESIQNRIIRKVISMISNPLGERLYPGNKDLTGDTIARVRDHLLVGRSGRIVEIGRRVQCVAEGERGVFCYRSENVPDKSVKYPEIKMITVKENDDRVLFFNKQKHCEYFDLDKLQDETGNRLDKIIIRQIQTGDVFIPFGCQGRMRLRKFLIDKKIPLSHREQLRVVAIDNIVLWIPGIRRSSLGTITKNTKKIIQLKVELEDIYDGK